MDRPVTSKSRGICRYYTTPRGCFAGDNCKFLHGADEKLTPYDKGKLCKYYAKGHCIRGDQCWFRHILKVPPNDERIRFSSETCCICLEQPTTYGLLTDCSHVFCLECIRQWRAPTGKSPDVVSSGTIKCCPLCRTSSRFVTPSSHFFPNGSFGKKETIDAYKASMAKVPCKYFDETSRTGKPCCPFGVDCFYQHTNPDGTPHIFRHGAKHSMNVYRRHRFRGANLPPARFDYDDPIEFLQHIFENPITNLHATLDVIRASLPALMERFAPNNELGDHDEDDEEEEMDDSINELLQDNLVVLDEAATSLSVRVGGDNLQPAPAESHADPVPLSTEQPRVPEPNVSSQETTVSSSRPLPQPQPARLSSRFSPVITNYSRQPFIIDISDEEEQEEEEVVQHTFDTDPSNPIEPSTSPDLGSTSIPQPSPAQQPTPLQSIGNLHIDTPLDHPQCEPDVDPPFVTDGRGRVVWSSTRNVSGRGNGAEGRTSRHSRTRSTPRVAYPPVNPTTPNGRGHAWGDQETHSVDGKVGREERNDTG